MRVFTLAAVLLMASTTPLSAAEQAESKAVDLTKIPRKIEEEPNYQDLPRYCLVVLGEKAQHRVWLVRDADQLFVDLDGDGRLTESPFEAKGSSVNVGELHLPRSAGRYSRFRTSSRSDGTTRIYISIAGRGYQIAGAMREPAPSFATSPEKAPIVHFDGPLTLHQYGSLQTLPRYPDGMSYRKTSLKLMVGTPGLGKGTFAAIHCKCRQNKTLRGEIAWPAANDKGQHIEQVAYKMHG